MLKYWKLEALSIGLGLLAVPLGLLNPYLTKIVIDKAYANRDLKLFLALMLIGGGVFILGALTNSLGVYIARRVNRHVRFDITRDLFRHLQGLSPSFFDNHSAGEHIYRVTGDTTNLSDFMCNTIPQVITLFPRLLFILAIVFYLNPKFALLLALLLPITCMHPYLFGKWMKDINRRIIFTSQGVFKNIQEVFSHIRLIKAFGREKDEIKKFEEDFSRQVDFELEGAKISAVSGFSNSIINKVLSGAVAFYGGYLVIKGAMTLGDFTAIMLYLGQLILLLGSVGSLWQNVIVNSVVRQRLAEILDTKPTVLDADFASPHLIRQPKVEFKNVSFGYREDRAILKNLSFSVPPAKRIALVGASGGGKTTILSLILRLYEQDEGVILIDGVDGRGITLESLKSQVGIALQEPFLWNDTVANNILYGARQAGRDDVVEASCIAEADGFIARLPDGYDSVIGEMACKLSEGQKQRLAIARAIISRPKILLLDEAMSSLDSETEERIMDNLGRKFREAVIITVSHRLSTVKKMDLVFFLKDGSRMEAARHEEFLDRDAGYRELFASQIALDNAKLFT